MTVDLGRLPLSAYLPFNRDAIGDSFHPAKHGTTPPPHRGRWLIVQDQALLVLPDGDGFQVPEGDRPAVLDGLPAAPIWLGSLDGVPLWVVARPREAPVPPGLQRETLVPMQGTRLPDDLLSLGGMALQSLHWDGTSGHCPRCGAATERIPGEFGKRCPGCRYEHYPHLHPAVIVLVRDGDRVLLTRKAFWSPGRYSLVAGFVDNGESLEGCVLREVKEEVGVDVRNISYVGSQNWPFPSQLMIGFVADYAGGEVVVDHEELEDARWFPVDALPGAPSRHSIARFIIDSYAGSGPGRPASPGQAGYSGA